MSDTATVHNRTPEESQRRQSRQSALPATLRRVLLSAAVRTREGMTIDADLFIDCSRFAGLLISQALKTPYVSFSENLFNDAAVAMPSPIGAKIPSETVSCAMKHGWAWKIPLTERFGNGCVYSSQFCSADQAETELRQRLGQLDFQTLPPRT